MNFHDLNDADWQQFIYLLLLLVVLLSGLFMRSNLPWSKVLKYLGIWSIVGFIAIALYAYRFEFTDFKGRIMGEINPASVRVTKSGEMVINLSQDGHFYMDLVINGQPMLFMVDTGASDIVIGIEEAKRIGIKEKDLVFNRRYQTANGTSWGASIILREVKVGDVRFNNVPASVNNAEMGTPLLGMSFLRQFSKYEFYRDRLVLTL